MSTQADDKERWLPIQGRGGAYWVSNHGRVRSHLAPPSRRRTAPWPIMDDPQRILSTKGRMGRYPCVNLNSHGRRTVRPVHRLVAEAFLGPCPEGYIVCHNDDDPTNNHLSNLRYDTYAANVQDAIRHGSKIGPPPQKQNHHPGKTIGVSVSLRQYQLNLIRKWAEDSGLSISKVIRDIIREYTLERTGGNDR